MEGMEPDLEREAAMAACKMNREWKEIEYHWYS